MTQMGASRSMGYVEGARDLGCRCASQPPVCGGEMLLPACVSQSGREHNLGSRQSLSSLLSSQRKPVLGVL